ncbi:hypothetical protein FA95DRAFT_1614124 [Auriscalpium vulgare]|uniref:Uncharacterized protein n=1 Tax=Auriscalpium vulgare TaxID=40419 RepID=A0ACB8R0V3_9AGAM|nr:hypothetical protein FA95DRAFT_1614124 [Auriscalpium vulgare]
MSAPTPAPRKMADLTVIENVRAQIKKFPEDAELQAQLVWVRGCVRAFTFAAMYPNAAPKVASLMADFQEIYKRHGSPATWMEQSGGLLPAPEPEPEPELDDAEFFAQMIASDADVDAFIAHTPPVAASGPLSVRAYSLAPIEVEDVQATDTEHATGDHGGSGEDELVDDPPVTSEPAGASGAVTARKRKGETDAMLGARLRTEKTRADALVASINRGDFNFRTYGGACDYCQETGKKFSTAVHCKYDAVLKRSGWTVECDKCAHAKKGCRWNGGNVSVPYRVRTASAAASTVDATHATVAGQKRPATATPEREEADATFKAPKTAHKTPRKETRASAQVSPRSFIGKPPPSTEVLPLADMEVDAPQDVPLESQTQRTVPGSERAGSWTQEVAEWHRRRQSIPSPTWTLRRLVASAVPTARKGKGKALRRHLLPPGPRPRDFASLPAVASLQHLIDGPIESIDGTQTAESIALIVQATRKQRSTSIATILAQGRIAIDNWWGDVGLINPPLWKAYLEGRVPRIMREEDEWYEVDEE